MNRLSKIFRGRGWPLHRRPRQLELNLWPNRQILSAAFSKKSATMRSRRWIFSDIPKSGDRWRGDAAAAATSSISRDPFRLKLRCRVRSVGTILLGCWSAHESHAVATVKATTFLLVTAGASFQYARCCKGSHTRPERHGPPSSSQEPISRGRPVKFASAR